jgi:4-hydroxy 2-oxovalerate aldolase
MAKLLDCTLRDGGYYNKWDFSDALVSDYLQAMEALNVDYVEIGFRSLRNKGFKGGCGFSTDEFLRSLDIPRELEGKIGVMVNASELVSHDSGIEAALNGLFDGASRSPVTLVRIACHVHEFESCLLASKWLKDAGYIVGFNLMQVADRTPEELTKLAVSASRYPLDVLYFADSMGGLKPDDIDEIVSAFRKGWSGAIGIHTHDNMGYAMANSLHAISNEVTWVDSTVTGMGRGPGNARTEYLAIEMISRGHLKGDMTRLLEIVRRHFEPLKQQFGWGSNPYYYLSGKYGIHPSFVQEMLGDARYSEDEILAAMEQLRKEGGKKFSFDTLEGARRFFNVGPKGGWDPKEVLEGREVLLLAGGPSLARHKAAIEAYIRRASPYVIALNMHSDVANELIDARVASHPVRLMADSKDLLASGKPIIMPFSMLPPDVSSALSGARMYDFGLVIEPNKFGFYENHCVVPAPLVVAYIRPASLRGEQHPACLSGNRGKYSIVGDHSHIVRDSRGLDLRYGTS